MTVLRKISIFGFLFILFFSVLSFNTSAKATNSINAYLFWGDGCPHCAKEKTFLAETLPDYPNVTLKTYEIYNNQNNVKLMQKVSDGLGTYAGGVPFLVIGDKGFVGFAEGSTDAEIVDQIKNCNNNGCPDSVATIVNDAGKTEKVEKPVEKSSEKKVIKIPFIGEINALDFSLPLLAVLMGGLDGFNPCAMWTLLFLISLLLGFEDRKKMWILGVAFITASAAVYFLFMAAWLKLILFLGFVIWVRLAIGAVALFGGGYNVRKGVRNKDGGCEVTGNEERKLVFQKLRDITKSKSFLLALGGIIILAFAVNLVELICSAGLPAIFTQVLAMSDLSTWQYFGYILLYILFFMLDDIIIFVAAMVTLRMTGISTKYSRWSSIIGGILMIIIGILLIFKPEWLMFG